METVKRKIQLLQQTLNDLKESASNETKSTAGDKHETALAMLQIEQENTSRQLENVLSQKLLLERINPTILAKQVANGTVVKTNNGYFFIGIPLGKVVVDGYTVTAISSQSPLGIKLAGLRANEAAVVNSMTYLVLSLE